MRGTGCTTAAPRRSAGCPPSRICTRSTSPPSRIRKCVLRLTAASDCTDAALHGTVRLVCPDGWTASPAELPFVLPPGEHLEADVDADDAAGRPAGALSGARRTRRHRRRRGVDAARLGARSSRTSCVVSVGTPQATTSRCDLVGEPEPTSRWRPARPRGWPSPSAPTRMRDLAVEAHLISPWGTWEWIGPAAHGARAARRRNGGARLRRRPAAVGAARRVVGADPGRLRRPAALLARGEGDGPMSHRMSPRTVAGVDGVRCRRGRRPRRPAARIAVPAASLPRAGTSEGRQLRRWLTQLLVTERVIAAEAAARRTDGRRCAERGRAAARHHGPAGDRQRRGAGAGRSAGPGAVRARHRGRRRHRRRRADYHARNPLRFAAPSAPETAGHRDTVPPLDAVRP